jgi:hypothetical protein
MIRAVTLVAVFTAVSCFGQTDSSDSQTLKAIISEIRAIHEEVKVKQTTQILLTELELQQSVVNRAVQRTDEAQSRLSETKTGERATAEEQARIKEKLDASTDPQETKALLDRTEDLKRQAALLATVDQERSPTAQTGQQQLKEAQDALDDIQNQLNAIVKRLNPARD